MSRIKRWFAGAASAALLLGFVAPATGQADEAVETPTNHAGACIGDSGVTVVIDYQKLGGNPEVRCFTGDPEDGVDAIRSAGFTLEGVDQWGDAFVCRINDRPAVGETVPILEDPEYTEDCVRTPPANGYWSYWHSDDQGESWEYSNVGAMGSEPVQGEWEGWSFSLNATAATNPAPRTGLALAEYRNADSTAAAADWIAGQWNPDATQFASGLADNIFALAAAEAHPEVVSQMLEAMVAAAPAYAKTPDALSKVLIALAMTGQDTHHFLGCDRDLVSELDAFVETDGSNLDSWWGPHLISIAHNRLGKPVPQNVFDLLMDRQKDDGSFGFPDDTGLALSALVGVTDNADNPQAMRDEADTAIADVIAWSEDPDNQKEQDGAHYWTSFSPANSTGILAGALAEADEDITSPQAFLHAQQKLTGVGAWSNTLNGTTANGMATTQAIFAVAGKSYGTATLEVPRVTPTCAAPTFTTQPTSVTATVGDTVGFTVAANGHPEPTFSWELNVGGTWATINGATEATLSFEDVTGAKAGLKVRATATNSLGSVTSQEATLTVKPVVTPTPGATTKPSTPTYPKTVYNTPGYHKVNGRNWFTSCEPYSVTQRCRTLIEATTVTQVGDRFVASKGWTFNNLTYLPSPEPVWKGNPLAKGGTWTTPEGRKWRTECNTPQTGRNGCRSYIFSKVVANVAKPGQPVEYGWTTRWEFNNIVQFS